MTQKLFHDLIQSNKVDRNHIKTMDQSRLISDAQSYIYQGDLSKLAELIENNHFILSANVDGDSLLHLACDNHQEEIVKYLILKNIEINAKNSLGETPLHISVFRGYSRIASHLLSHGADPYIKADDNRSTFDYALEFGEASIQKLLSSYNQLDSQTLNSNDYLLSSTTSIFENLTLTMESPLRHKCLTERDHPVIVEETSVLDESGIKLIKINRTLPFETLRDDRLKTKSNFIKEELFDFLEKYKIRPYFKLLVMHGFDHLNGMLLMMKTQRTIDHFVLNEIGIYKAGDRSRIIVALESAASSVNFRTNYEGIEELLGDIGLDFYLLELKRYGIYKLEFILENAYNPSVFNEDMLKTHIKMHKYGHRRRFLSIIQHLASIENKFIHSCILI